MIDILDTFPTSTSQPAEYMRLLGYPAGTGLEGRARGAGRLGARLVCRARAAWIYARERELARISAMAQS